MELVVVTLITIAYIIDRIDRGRVCNSTWSSKENNHKIEGQQAKQEKTELSTEAKSEYIYMLIISFMNRWVEPMTSKNFVLFKCLAVLAALADIYTALIRWMILQVLATVEDKKMIHVTSFECATWKCE